MSRKVTITIPSELAQELDSTGQELLVEILERGLRELKIERVLDRYAQGGSLLARRHTVRASRSLN